MALTDLRLDDSIVSGRETVRLSVLVPAEFESVQVPPAEFEKLISREIL